MEPPPISRVSSLHKKCIEKQFLCRILNRKASKQSSGQEGNKTLLIPAPGIGRKSYELGLNAFLFGFSLFLSSISGQSGHKQKVFVFILLAKSKSMWQSREPFFVDVVKKDTFESCSRAN